jgi:hypothetical protein
MQRTPAAKEVDRGYLGEALIGEHQRYRLSCIGGFFQHPHCCHRRFRPEYPIIRAETPIQIRAQRTQNRLISGQHQENRPCHAATPLCTATAPP